MAKFIVRTDGITIDVEHLDTGSEVLSEVPYTPLAHEQIVGSVRTLNEDSSVTSTDEARFALRGYQVTRVLYTEPSTHAPLHTAMQRIAPLLALLLLPLFGACTRTVEVPMDAATAQLLLRRDSLQHVRKLQLDSLAHARESAQDSVRLALIPREAFLQAHGIEVTHPQSGPACVEYAVPTAGGIERDCTFRTRAQAVAYGEALLEARTTMQAEGTARTASLGPAGT